MRLAFLGTPEFAVPSLHRLVEAGFDVAAVLTQPDRPRGRGQQPASPPVKEAALRLGLEVHQPERVRRPEVVDFMRGLRVDAMALVGYGQIIPQAVLDLPPLGLVNVHASLLPHYRGAAPIQWAIANGETRTGVTTMRIDAGLDTGDILMSWETEIGPEENAIELAARLAPAGAGLLVDTLRALAAGAITPRPQDHARATHAPILKKEDGLLDWNWPAQRIHDRVRGFQPWPGVHTGFRDHTLHIWKTRPALESIDGAPGTLHPRKRRLFACCGRGSCLELLEVQVEGRKRMSAEAFLNGQRVAENEILKGRAE